MVYCIVGTRAGGLTVQIVGATHVASAKAALDAVASVDIHSLAPVSQAAQSDGERKTVAAEMWSASETWRRALFNGTDESSMRFKANAASAITSDLLKIRLAERERSGAPAYVAPPPVGAAPAPRAPYIAPKKAPAAKAAKAPVKKKPSMFAAKPNSKKPAVKKGAVAAPAKPAAAPKPKPMPKKGGMASFFGKKAGTASTAQKKTVAKKPTPAAPVAAGLGLAASDDEEEDSVAENASPKRTIKRKKKVGSGAKKKRRLKKKTAAEDEDAGAEGANGESGGAAPQDLFVQQETSRVAEADGDSMPDMRTEADLEKARAAKKWAQVLKAKAKEGQEDEIDRSVIQTVKMGSRTSPKKRKLVTTTCVALRCLCRLLTCAPSTSVFSRAHGSHAAASSTRVRPPTASRAQLCERRGLYGDRGPVGGCRGHFRLRVEESVVAEEGQGGGGERRTGEEEGDVAGLHVLVLQEEVDSRTPHFAGAPQPGRPIRAQ